MALAHLGNQMLKPAQWHLLLQLLPKLGSYAKEMASDPKILQSINMERMTPLCKLWEGLRHALRESLIMKLKIEFFSINSNECTSAGNHEKILTARVCYFDDQIGESTSVTDMLRSLQMQFWM